MSRLVATTEASFFCLIIIVFLFVLKLKSTLEVNKRIKVGYIACILGILNSALIDFLVIQTALFAICCICYAAALFLTFGEKRTSLIALISVLFAGAAFYTLSLGLNVATYAVTLAFIIHFVFEQLNLIMTDNLTGLYNLYARKLEIEEQERQYKHDHSDSFYIIVCDLDRFKTINDTWGHPEGDRALELVATALTKVAKQFNAKVFRVGGDEFQIIADTSDEKEAEKIEKALKEEFDKIKFRDDFDIEISIGKALYNGEDETDELLAEADSRMYAEKARRKNK